MSPKTLVTSVAVVLVMCSAAVIASYVSAMGFAKFPTQVVRFVLTCLLSYSLIRGWSPGRWIAIVLIGLAAVGSIVGGVVAIQKASAGLLLIVLGTIYLACVVALLTPFAAAHFSKRDEAATQLG